MVGDGAFSLVVPAARHHPARAAGWLTQAQATTLIGLANQL